MLLDLTGAKHVENIHKWRHLRQDWTLQQVN